MAGSKLRSRREAMEAKRYRPEPEPMEPEDNLPALKPCPFCGGPVQLELAKIARDWMYGDKNGERRWYGVTCRNTINHGGTCCMDQVPSASKEAAVKRWNMRDGRTE